MDPVRKPASDAAAASAIPIAIVADERLHRPVESPARALQHAIAETVAARRHLRRSHVITVLAAVCVYLLAVSMMSVPIGA